MRVIEVDVWVKTVNELSYHEDVIDVEIPDGLTEEQEEEIIAREAKEWMIDNIEWSYNRK